MNSFETMSKAIDTLVEARLFFIAKHSDSLLLLHAPDEPSYERLHRDFFTLVVDPGQRSGKSTYAVSGSSFKFPIVVSTNDEKALILETPCKQPVFSISELTQAKGLASTKLAYGAFFMPAASTITPEQFSDLRRALYQRNPRLLFVALEIPHAFCQS